MNKLPVTPIRPQPDAGDPPVTTIRPEAPVRRISSRELLEGGRELVIQHLDHEYHLRLTRNDRLILTK